MQLLNALKNAVKKELKSEKKVGLFFSGGLDSSIIGKILVDVGADVLPITVGEPKSEDVLFSKKTTEMMFRKHLLIRINEKNVKEAIPNVIKITGERDVITVSVGCVVYFAAKYASKFGVKTVFTGAGSDELFAGYKSHEIALRKGLEEVNKECKKRLEGIKKDIQRDKRICSYFGLNVKTPFLDKDVIETALNIPPEEKISENEKKIVLRKLAKDIGLPSIVYNRKKKAAQYGTKVQKIIKKIARNEKIETIEDFLKNVYKKQKSL